MILKHGLVLHNLLIVWTQMTYKLHIGLIKESSGYSSAVLNLPGVFSQGESRQEALYQVLDAFDLTIESYLEYRETPPWASDYDISDFNEDFWIEHQKL